ncbi:hypothetical protein Nepgr_013544 [Nepenthes gracilis]|uniref:Uncharacterized protein n=1 Tax=Nepenthes gracilis TaxID=150966 RepID=A0AAD3SI23_NEPGR|nr:hypothetical protein Nepgr_013544 [Nepenthes gracilis]
MPVVVRADPLHRGPAAIGYSSWPPHSPTPPRARESLPLFESSNSLKISLGRSSSSQVWADPINHPHCHTVVPLGHHAWFTTTKLRVD